tara:strand:- start:100 stop:564 length:465 start_codon:yes stop_codon:yes gene_type:complete
LAPIFRIDRPDVDDGVEIVVTIGCEFPWDLDSDSSDNEARLILSGGSVGPSGYADMGIAVTAALLVIGVSLAFAWMLRSHREGKELMEMAMAAAEERAAKKRIEPESSDAPEPSQMEQDEDEEDGEEEDGPEPEIEDEPLDDFETRLKRLMRED